MTDKVHNNKHETTTDTSGHINNQSHHTHDLKVHGHVHHIEHEGNQDSNENCKLLTNQDLENVQHEVNLEPKKMRLASKIKNIVLEEDYYALTWLALRQSVWNNKKIRGEAIYLTPSDFFWIHINFLVFLFLLVITIMLILWEVIANKGYVASNLSIVILRITLVSFAQKALAPEFFQGLFLLRFSIRYPDSFTHHEFAVFVGACQLVVSCICFCSIILFVCMEEEALTLVVEFAGLTVIANLDNWIGEVIMFSKIKSPGEDEEEEGLEGGSEKGSKGKLDNISENDNHEFDLKNINKNMSLHQKMALLEEDDMTMIDDQNEIEDVHWVVHTIEYVIDLLPWQYCLPFITVVFNYVLPLLRPAEEE